MITTFPIVALFILLGLAIPVGLVMALVGMAGLHSIGGWDMVSGIVQSTPLSTAGSYELLTLPMFLLMAEFVLISGVADDLFRAGAAWTGRVRGGLGMATALAGAGFGAICGTSTAAAATLSATTLPAMIKQGYRPDVAAGVVAISGTLSMLIPPSVALIIYGLIAEVNIGKLLVAGIVPAMIVTFTIIATIYVLVLRDPSVAPAGPAVPWAEKFRLLKVTGPVLLLFAFVTGTIYSGIATPTEASALGALAGFGLALSSGKLNLGTFRKALVRATYGTCMIMLIILGATIFGYYFALTQITQDLIIWVQGLGISPWIVMVMIVAFYLVLGCFMDQTAILILTVPVIVPLVVALGFDPIWFGVVMIVTAEVGLLTPPVGLNCFVVSRYSGIPLSEVFKGVLPHILAHLLALALIVGIPEITLWLPSHMN
ncbi:tripartite ATP-independent transporter DctM subunit [Rhodoligotrophos appendicifer]|uniref:TRAP transporter large permease n=1 Tax=Rhodoligotrophos appendicifer TaxID=987056 RepID=UPI0011852092|nr:TRAP transporter large permease [Rhodoligotrophos appendicifer]